MPDNYAKLRVGIIVLIVVQAAMLVYSAILIYLSSNLQSTVNQYGFGQAPPAKVETFVGYLSWSDFVGYASAIISVMAIIFSIFQTSKSLGYLGISQHFSPGPTAFTFLIPFVCFYYPWAGLSEVRNTLKTGVAFSHLPREGMRGIEPFTFFYGLITFAYIVVNELVETAGKQLALKSPNDLQSFNDLFSGLVRLNITLTICQAIFVAILASYWLSILNLYSRCWIIHYAETKKKLTSENAAWNSIRPQY
jgi:hypothetical protein